MNKNENKSQSLKEVYNSPEATSKRLLVKKEINQFPRPNFSQTFKKDDKERGEFITEKAKWLKSIKAKEGFKGKRQEKAKSYLKVS